MPRYARLERHALADALLATGPDAPTLCAGWSATDLAAHIVLRDRRPDAALGIVLPPLAGWTARVQRRLAERVAFGELVARVRTPPRWILTSLRPLDEATNTVEFFIHTEDVRRAAPDWRPRRLPEGLPEALWRRVPLLAKLRLRRFGAPVAVRSAGHGEVVTGGGPPRLVLRGAPGELLMFLFGRRQAAEIAIDGPPDLADRLRTGH